MLSLYHYADWEIPLRPSSRYPLQKFQLLVDEIKNLSEPVRFRIAPAEPALRKQVCRIHSDRFFEAVLNQKLSGEEEREMGFPNSENLSERALRICGATIAAAESALKDGAAGVLGGGAHHSFRDHGRGFCVFNDIAVAAAELRERGVKRITIFDCDVHQGDGTASLFQGEAEIFTVSIHAESNYPFRKERSDLDIGLPDTVTDEAYLASVEGALAESIQKNEPELVIYIAGADPYKKDQLGRLSLSAETLKERDRLVLKCYLSRRIPVCIVLGGGYCSPIEQTVALNCQTFQTAGSVWLQHQNLFRTGLLLNDL